MYSSEEIKIWDCLMKKKDCFFSVRSVVSWAARKDHQITRQIVMFAVPK